MHFIPIRTPLLNPPRDDLFAALRAARLRLKDGDVMAISSKVVSIHEGRTLPLDSIPKRVLVKREADYYFVPRKTKYRRIFTVARGIFVGSSGVDESNGNGWYVLYPRDPMRSARRIRSALVSAYSLKRLGVIITDSMSTPLRRGAIGIALGYAGFKPLRDYRGSRDLFGRTFVFEVANVADALASGANLAMGEGAEQTPVCVIREAPVAFTASRTPRAMSVAVPMADDLFAPLFGRVPWKRGG